MKEIILSIIIGTVIIGGALVYTRGGFKNTNSTINEENSGSVNNVSIVDGKQIIEIKAKGGFLPRESFAKAGIPTILRFDTNGTFDCSSSVSIPSIGVSKILPSSGVTDIDIGTQPATVLNGTCGMGMYPFQIDFQG